MQFDHIMIGNSHQQEHQDSDFQDRNCNHRKCECFEEAPKLEIKEATQISMQRKAQCKTHNSCDEKTTCKCEEYHSQKRLCDLACTGSEEFFGLDIEFEVAENAFEEEERKSDDGCDHNSYDSIADCLNEV